MFKMNKSFYLTNPTSDKERRQRLASAYRIILGAANRKHKEQKQTPKTDEFADQTDFGAETQEGDPEHDLL